MYMVQDVFQYLIPIVGAFDAWPVRNLVDMSGRNNHNERAGPAAGDPRARDREARQQEAIVIAIRRHAAENRVRGGGGGDNGRVAGVVDRAGSPRGTPHGTGGTKRKLDTTFGPETVEQWASTELEQETFAFMWSIKNYIAMSGSNEEIKSPVFKGGPKSNHQWQMKMNPKKKVDDTEYFAVHLILNGFGDGEQGSNSRKIKVRFQISLLCPEGRPLKQAGSPTMSVCEFKKYSVWGYDKFLQTSELVNPTRHLIEDDTLKIHCRVWIEGEVRHRWGAGGAVLEKNSVEEIKRRRQSLLSNHLQNMLDDGLFADVALSTETKTFMAHKSILSARSEVFKAMFNTRMVEAKENTVEINDFDADVVKAMLEYIYTGETEDLNEKAPELMQIAEKYDLAGLKEDCEQAIASNLTVENAAEVLVLAHLHNAIDLKSKAIEFINRNKDDVRKTVAFQEVAGSNASVFVDLYLSQ